MVVSYRVSGPCGEVILCPLVTRVMAIVMIMPAEIRIYGALYILPAAR